MTRQEFHERERLKRGAKSLAGQIHLVTTLANNGFLNPLGDIDRSELIQGVETLLSTLRQADEKILKVKPVNLPADVQRRLAQHQSDYSELKTVFHAFVWSHNFQTQKSSWAGVVGDGDNAAYEWFIDGEDGLKVSNLGYGDTVIALREVLNKVAPPEAEAFTQGDNEEAK
jgi:hypothetical protein